MHYVCIENNTVISILNYEPAVPDTVLVVTISDAEYSLIEARTHFFDATAKVISPVAPEVLSLKATAEANAEDLEFLRSTDWQIMRHLRQTALGIPTSLSNPAYLALEQQRQEAASRIV